MSARDWFRPPRQVVTAFVAVAVVSAVALGGLTWQVLDQDRELEAKRIRDRLDLAADRAEAAMDRALLDLDGVAGASGDTTLPTGVVAITIAADGLMTLPGGGLVFHPGLTADAEASGAARVFAEGERLEHVERDVLGAARAYTSLGRSADAATRAGALLRLARVERKRGAFDEALQVYDALARSDAALVDGIPAALAARLGRITTFSAANQPEARQREASALLTDLARGRWPITRGMYESYRSEAQRWVATPGRDDDEAVALAKAAEWLWSNRADLGASGRRLVALDRGPALVAWRVRTGGAGELEAVVAGRTTLEAMAVAAFGPDVRWSLVDTDGRLVIGDQPESDLIVERGASTAGLPWGFLLSAGPGQQTLPSRMPLVLVLGVVALVVAAGWYFVFRSLSRERQVAALQANFVSAVSHEFRSPLTALAHAAELLSTDRLPSEPLRREAYGVLTRETERLRGLVDGLLDSERFGKGATAFRFETIGLDALVGDTVSAFRDHVAPAGYSVELAMPAAWLFVRTAPR